MKAEDVKIGMRVKVKGPWSDWDGKIVTITEMDFSYKSCIDAQRDDGVIGAFALNELEPLEQQFSVGDQVELVEEYDSHSKGTRGIIRRIKEDL